MNVIYFEISVNVKSLMSSIMLYLLFSSQIGLYYYMNTYVIEELASYPFQVLNSFFACTSLKFISLIPDYVVLQLAKFHGSNSDLTSVAVRDSTKYMEMDDEFR